MSRLFVRPNGTQMQFHLADLSEDLLTRYTTIIEQNGGKITLDPNEKILTFTLQSFCHKYSIVFDIKFIDDCLTSKKILNITDYYIGDYRFFSECKMLEMLFGDKICICPDCGNKHVENVQ